MGKIQIVVGGQYGSEGKGAVCAFLARELGRQGINIRVAGPNAGHTAYDAAGRKYALRQVPIGAVTSMCQLGIAAGSEIDLDVLEREVYELQSYGHQVIERLWIHPTATVLTDEHKYREGAAKLTDRIGSTGKGIGAARADRIMRTANRIIDRPDGFADLGHVGWDNFQDRYGTDILIEGTQGYGLGLHTDNYPQTTSSDCRAIDFLSMAGVNPWHRGVTGFTVWVVARVYPIRVAGNSGPLHGETTWQDLGLPEERTTVTQKVRRVGRWDPKLVAEAVEANGGRPYVKLAITMLDQMFPEVTGAIDTAGLSPDACKWLSQVEQEVGAEVGLIGTSPSTIVDVR